MQVIGLLGGMSWESSAQYYRLINQTVREKLGGTHSARSLMWSMDFGEIEHLQHTGQWDVLAQKMVEAALNLQRGGADFIVICTNTMHRMYEQLVQALDIPVLHIADPTGAKIVADGVQRVALLGTAFTMEQPFYKERLQTQYGLEVLVPDETDRHTVHRIIYEELVAGQVLDASRQQYQQVIERLAERGAQAVILGCTEIMLLIQPQDSCLPVYDTTTLHALAAVEQALR